MFNCTKALAMLGLLCIVKTELGQKPNVSLKKSTNSLTWGSVISINGSTKGIVKLYHDNFESLKVKNLHGKKINTKIDISTDLNSACGCFINSAK
jgi:hypothetical protein